MRVSESLFERSTVLGTWAFTRPVRGGWEGSIATPFPFASLESLLSMAVPNLTFTWGEEVVITRSRQPS